MWRCLKMYAFMLRRNVMTPRLHALADLGDCYVNDAFSAAHRAHASTEGVARILPSIAGRLLEAELNALNKALEAPTHPVAAVIGGAKVSTKLAVLKNLVQRVISWSLAGGWPTHSWLHRGTRLGRRCVSMTSYQQRAPFSTRPRLRHARSCCLPMW